jgi:hypothetical protein
LRYFLNHLVIGIAQVVCGFPGGEFKPDGVGEVLLKEIRGYEVNQLVIPLSWVQTSKLAFDK